MPKLSSAEGDYATAHSLYRESLTIRREIGDRYGITVCLVGLGAVAVRAAADKQEHPDSRWDLEQLERGVRLLGAADALSNVIGAPLMADECRVYQQGLAIARDAMDEAAFAKAWAEGRAMSMEQAVELAQHLL
jgi:hypothetical protein